MYKGLTAQQSHLNIKLSGVKSSITLGPLSTIELDAALSVAVQSRLREHGWPQLDKQQFVGSNVWDLAASGQQIPSVKVSVACDAPAYVVMRVETGATSTWLAQMYVQCHCGECDRKKSKVYTVRRLNGRRCL